MAPELVEQNLQLLRQATELLRKLDDTDYRGPSGRQDSAGVGAHLRHCLDFYRCFLRDLEGGRVDYDRRDRNERIESDRAAALESIREIERDLAAVTELRRPVDVRVDVYPDEDDSEAWSRTSVARELRFLASHTVHHFALISQALRSRGIEPGREFGVAPSTLAYWRQQAPSPG